MSFRASFPTEKSLDKSVWSWWIKIMNNDNSTYVADSLTPFDSQQTAPCRLCPHIFSGYTDIFWSYPTWWWYHVPTSHDQSAAGNLCRETTVLERRYDTISTSHLTVAVWTTSGLRTKACCRWPIPTTPLLWEDPKKRKKIVGTNKRLRRKSRE